MRPEDRKPGQPPSPTERVIRLEEVAADIPVAPGVLQLLSSTDVEQREQALADLVRWGLTAREVPAVVELMADPDVTVRVRAIEALAGSADDVDPPRLRDALGDPADAVRAAAVGLIARRRTPDLSDLLGFLPSRQWRLAQRRTLEVLPSLVHRAGLSEAELSSLLMNVARLVSPPTASERERFAELARAVGCARIAEAFTYKDNRRLGAAWLLLAEGSAPSLREVAALASDTLDEVRLAAAAARGRLDELDAAPGKAGARMVDLVAVERTTETEVTGLLVGALRDPDRVVRDRAWAALTVTDWQVLLEWVREALRAGSEEDAGLAAHVAERLMLSQVAASIMDRAARMPAETRGSFESALGSFGSDPRDLAGLVVDVDASRRDTAVWIAWRAGGRAVLPHLGSLLTDTSGSVRRAVLEVMDEAGDPETHGVAQDALEMDPSSSVRLAAIRVLADAPRARRAAALERAIRDPDPAVRAEALMEFPRGLAATAVPYLLEGLEDADERVFEAALRQLVAPERDAGEMWEGLDRCRDDRRSRFIEALEGVGAGRLEALALGRLRSTSDAERLLAVELIVRAGTPACLQVAMDALGDPSAAVRAGAANALGSLGHPAAVPALGAALADPDAEVRVAVVRALAAVDDRGALRHVVTGLLDPDERVCEEVVRALGSLPMGRSTVDLFMDWVAEQGYVIAPQAGWLLERVVGADAFTERLSSLDRHERLRAVRVVAAIGGPLAMTALVGVLGDPDQEVRVRALRGLGALGDRRAIGAVERTISNDPVREVVSEAQEALRWLVERREDGA